MRLNIISINAGTQTITVAGDYTLPLQVGVKFQLFNGVSFVASPAPNGLWTVNTASISGINTDVIVNEVMSPTVIAIELVSAIYEVNLSDPLSTPIFVSPETVDHSTSLALNGKGSMSYGENLIENMIHLLEHFASSIAPITPIAGQLWYDTTIDQFKVWNGSSWIFVISQVRPYDLFATVVGTPSSSFVIGRFVVGRNFSTGVDVAGSQASAEVAAAASTVFSVEKNGVQFATITYDIGSTIGTFLGAAETFIPGDKLTIVAPAVADATLSDPAFTIIGNLT